MTVRRKSEIAVCEAIQRLVSGQPIRAENCMLVDLNLAIEAGVSRATMYRSEAMQDWRKAKESAVRRAIIVLKHRAVDNPSLVLTDADLVREAMVERAALREFPKFQAEWQAVKDNQMCQLSIERSDPDRVITSLVSTIYGLALALRRKDEIIQVQAKQLEIGSGKIAAFPPRRL